MSPTRVKISEVLGELNTLAPAGYAIGLQITYTTPKFMFQSYSIDWLNYYSQNGLLMMDPTLGWGPLLEGDVELYEVESHHGNIIHGERGVVVADIIDRL